MIDYITPTCLSLTQQQRDKIDRYLLWVEKYCEKNDVQEALKQFFDFQVWSKNGINQIRLHVYGSFICSLTEINGVICPDEWIVEANVLHEFFKGYV